MGKEKVVVYGLTTEGYFIACQMIKSQILEDLV